MQPLETIGFLIGSWRVERLIEDHRSGLRGTFDGTATFIEFGHGDDSSFERRARFDEAGELCFGAYRGPSRRSLEYVQKEGAAAQIYFTDGRPFIELNLSSGTWQSTHLCGLDRYEINFSVKSDDLLEERWRVKGSNKDYEASATLTRNSTPTPPTVANP